MTDRLWRLARAELGAVRRRWQERVGASVDEDAPPAAGPPPADPRPRRRSGSESPWPQQVQAFYANLELPVGAPREQVRAAYRRLMRRYHPDLHGMDPDRAQVAHRVSLELRQAYEGILAHLDQMPRSSGT